MEDKLLGSLTETRLLPLKASAPIEVTESGISKLRITDRLKALSPILVRESGNSIAVREVELLKELLPIETTGIPEIKSGIARIVGQTSTHPVTVIFWPLME